MTLPAADMVPSSASPLPDGAIAPPRGDSAPEPVPSSGTPVVKLSASETPPAKPPAASLISIAGKAKASGPAKSGDLTRFIELARRQGAAAPAAPLPAEQPVVPAAEIEAAPYPMAAVPVPIEVLVVEARGGETAAAPAPLETAAPLEQKPVTPAAEPVIAPEAMAEPNFPLMLAPPSAVTDADATGRVDGQPDPAPICKSDVIDAPDWVKAISTVEDTHPSETAEPIKVSLFPMAGTLPAADVLPPAPKASELRPVAVAPLASAAASIPAAPRTSAFKELADYWRSLRHGDEHPAAETIDRDLVTERWPGSLLMTYMPASQDQRGELRPSRVTRLGTACAEAQSVAEVGSQSTEWMLEVARTALVNDEPVEEQQRLETLTGVAGFRMVALPLGPTKALPNAVLCILTPSPGAPRFGKRRIWL